MSCRCTRAARFDCRSDAATQSVINVADIATDFHHHHHHLEGKLTCPELVTTRATLSAQRMRLFQGSTASVKVRVTRVTRSQRMREQRRYAMPRLLLIRRWLPPHRPRMTPL